MATYKIKNEGSRGQAFRGASGLEVVKPGEERALELSDDLTDERIEQLKEAGVTVGSHSGKTDDTPRVAYGRYKDAPTAKQADDPAETGGVVARSKVSSRGGVDRAEGDTTTTTKPTTEQKGAKA